jgi:hypothetical protein
MTHNNQPNATNAKPLIYCGCGAVINPNQPHQGVPTEPSIFIQYGTNEATAQPEPLPKLKRAVDVVEWETIEELCPSEATLFSDALFHHDIYELDFAVTYYMQADIKALATAIGDRIGRGIEDIDERAANAASTIVDAWEALRSAFASATKAGHDSSLDLGLGYTWDCEDCPTEVCYTVEGAYQLSPAGKKCAEKLSRVQEVWTKGTGTSVKA